MVVVHLAVYDLSHGMAATMSQGILGERIDGIWHSGVRVFGKEWFFGGGVQIVPIGTFEQMHGINTHHVDRLGETIKTEAELRAYLQTINSQWTAATYNLLSHNCNNFADTVARFLTNNGIDPAVVDLPSRVFSTPNGAMLRPMIEGMTNNINGIPHTMDSFSTNMSQSLQQPMPDLNGVFGTGMNNNFPTVAGTQVPARSRVSAREASLPARATLDEKPLLSNASTAQHREGMVNRLLKLKKPVLDSPTQAEKSPATPTTDSTNGSFKEEKFSSIFGGSKSDDKSDNGEKTEKKDEAKNRARKKFSGGNGNGNKNQKAAKSRRLASKVQVKA